MRRSLALLGALSVLALVPASASAAATVGISDQTPSSFASPFFPELKSKVARYIAPWDVMTDQAQLEKLRAWIAGAQAQRQRILIHFEHSRKSPEEAGRAPSVAAYKRALRAFKKEFPQVREIGVWNEANRKRVKKRNVGQPTAGKPKLLASYYKAAKSVFKGSKYKIVALDILDEPNPAPALAMLASFQRAVGASESRKLILGLHNYSDTNRGSTSRTRRILAKFKGREVWLTETGGIVKIGDKPPLGVYDEARAARAIGCMFTLAKSSKKIKRLYVYNYNAPFSENDIFDAGLIGKDGQPRPGFAAVKSRKATSCAKVLG